MQKKRNISSPKAGMNRDTHSSLLKPSEYTLAINANTENETGEKLNITNEPSNYLAVVFPAGFKVIGFKYNLPSNKTYFWLTNPETKKSSVGYIDSIEISQENVDQYNQCTECRGLTELGTPLENVEQTPFNNYVTLFDDINCEETLEFDLNYPIKNIEIKNEKGQVTAYWDDNKNPSRFTVLSDPSYLFSQTIPCEEEEQLPATCLFVDRLLHFPNYTPMNIQAEGIQTGGNLKLGTYEFWGTYCDIKGNNIVNYSTPTQPISIFDENNSLLEQTELDSFTNYSIKLTVNNLDTTFAYYKIVCVERTNINNTQSAFVAGIYPTTDNTVLYSSSGTSNDDEYLQNGNASIRRRIDFNELYQVRPTYKSAKGTTSSGNILWKWGLKEKETLNLQPVVNLFGSLLKWQTSVAKESLFKSPVACSKYKGYMRNEVQPFALRFYDLDGNYTPVFPIIGRPSVEGEKESFIKTSGTLKQGSTYIINELLENDSFDNVGFTTTGEPFTVGLTVTPTVWNASTVVYEINAGSISANSSSCAEEGLEKWQVQNTASKISQFGEVGWDCQSTLEEVDTEPIATTKQCVIESVGIITASTQTLTENLENYTDLKTYIEENPDVIIPNLTQYLEESLYQNDNCTPSFVGCGAHQLIDSFIKIDKVEEEQATYIKRGINDYQRNYIASSSSVYQRNDQDGTYLRDTEFEDLYGSCSGGTRKKTYKRNFDNIQNETCNYAVPIINNNSLTSPGQAFYNNYYAELLEANLKQSTKNVFITDTHFKDRLHKGALWFKAEKVNRNLLVLEITKNSSCSVPDDITDLAKTLGNKLRYNIYKSCSDNTPTHGGIFSSDNGLITELDVSNITSNVFYIAIDAPIIEQEIPVNCGNTFIANMVFKIVPPCGVFTPFIRDIEYSSITATWESISINKYQKYQADCIFKFPKVSDCEPTSYANGEFAYWESTETYPDNEELYDSSNLLVTTTDLEDLTIIDKNRFLNFYQESIIAGVVKLKNANFRCQAIRHPKMPDNTLAPFISSTTTKFSEALIFPLGVNLDKNAVKLMLKVAVNNKLITQKQADNIAGYEILRGDNTLHKSVLANGLGYDMYKYTRDSKDYYYSNYPFNDLGEDTLHYENDARSNLIPHPFAGQGNNKYTIISPDLLLNTPTLSTHLVMSGYQTGTSNGQFSEVKDHPKWTILGRKARSSATTLAILEAALELALRIAESAEVFRVEVKVGTSSGGSVNPVGVGIQVVAALAAIVATPLKVAQYRHQWLKTFRDLGTQYNFASYNVAEGYYNSFSPNLSEKDYVRGLSLAKYIKDGEYKYIDENQKTPLYVNNYLREHGTLLSLGKSSYNFNYASDFKNHDNSRTIASETDCTLNQEYQNDIGSPYFTLKSNISDQFGIIDSVKWLTTNYYTSLNSEESGCTTVFGGTVVISRFTWKRKIPIFKATAMGLPDKISVEYSPYKNIGEPRFFCDYETDTSKDIAGIPVPDIDSRIELDCLNDNFYVKPNSKFYLYYYGITNFLVESEINCNFRYGKREPKNQFYPQVGDLKDWTQEVNVPIKEPNTFYYNNVYSLPVSNSPYSFLDATYSKLLWESRGDQENAVIYSEPDNSQNEIFDSWRVFKPLNWNEFDKKYGKLIGLKDLESSQLLAQFENGMLVLGAVDSLADRITPQNRALGTAGIFSTRPTEFKRTDLGFAGTQNTEIVSTPYGHLWADALRGKVFMLDQNAKGLEIISEMLGNQPTGMKNWFKENLPFKILKDFPSADIDNKYKGLGLNIWYDSRFDRVFITKKDYISKGEECLKYEEGLGFYKDCEETVISCPTGYTYNEDTEMCEKITTSDDLCPIGYAYNEELQTCTLIEVVNAECPVIDENTQINIWFDNSGSMNTTLPKLQEMRDTILKPCIGAIYGYDPLVPGSDANYNSKVQVLNFSQNEDSNERYIKLLAKTSADPTITKVINLAFADEADRYGAVGGFGGNITSDASIDISTLRSILEGGDANYLVGVVFQVATGGVSTPTYPGFRTFVTNLHTGIAPFTGVSGLGDKPEISYVLNVIPASTPTYYTNLIIAALNNLGFNLEPCIS